MFCNRCGKEMPDGAAFCNECGNRLETIPFQKTEPEVNLTETEIEVKPREGLPSHGTAKVKSSVAAQAVKDAAFSFRQSDFLKKVFKYMEVVGCNKLSCQLSAAFLLFLLTVRLLGHLFTTILVSAVNAFFIYYLYKKEKRFDWKMLTCSLAAFLIGILVSFYIL